MATGEGKNLRLALSESMRDGGAGGMSRGAKVPAGDGPLGLSADSRTTELATEDRLWRTHTGRLQSRLFFGEQILDFFLGQNPQHEDCEFAPVDTLLVSAPHLEYVTTTPSYQDRKVPVLSKAFGSQEASNFCRKTYLASRVTAVSSTPSNTIPFGDKPQWSFFSEYLELT